VSHQSLNSDRLALARAIATKNPVLIRQYIHLAQDEFQKVSFLVTAIQCLLCSCLRRVGSDLDLCRPVCATTHPGLIKPHGEPCTAVFDEKTRAILDILILEGKVDVNSRGSNHHPITAMSMAAISGSVPLIQYLHSHGASYASPDPTHSSPMELAVLFNRFDAALFLFQQNSDNEKEHLLSFALKSYL